MELLELARRVIGIERDGLVRLAERLDGAFERAVEILRETLDRKGKIVVVLEIDGRPVGLIDTQDLARLKIV